MRAAPLLALSLAGCLGAPTGRDPAAIDASSDAAVTPWPPPGADIIAIGAGDLDGDGAEDLIVADAAGDRVHLLRGGVDLDPDRATAATATASAPLGDLRGPAAILVTTIGSNRRVLVLDSPAAGPRVTVFDDELTQTGAVTIATSPPMPEESVRIEQSTFGMAMNAVFIALPDSVHFMEGASVDDAMPQLLVPMGTTFSDVRAASGFVAGGQPPTPTVIVGEETRTQLATSTGPGEFAWTDLRPAGSTPWTAQIFARVDGDPIPELLAFVPDVGTAYLCGVDVARAMVLGCYATPYAMTDAAIDTGAVAAAGQLDLVLLDVPATPPAMPALFLTRRLRIATGALTADGDGPPFFVNLPAPRHAVLQLDGGAEEVIVVGRDGRALCLRGAGVSFGPCGP